MRKSLNILSILAASFTHLIAGIFVSGMGQAHAQFFMELNVKLSVVSQAAVLYAESGAPVAVGLVLGLVTLVGLCLVLRSEKHRWLLPFLLSISFVLVIIHINFVWFGVNTPLLKMVQALGE